MFEIFFKQMRNSTTVAYTQNMIHLSYFTAK